MQGSSNNGRWFWGIFISLILIVIIFFGISLMIFSTTMFTKGGDYYYESTGKGNGKIAVVDLDFTIYFSEAFVRQFKKFREDKSIKGIILRINTPGGGVAASQEMYEEVRKTRESGKPVIVSFGSIAASGGYYIACGGSRIVSNPGTLTGSIGVIMQLMTFKDLADKLGIKETTVKSGELKDSGDPFRELNSKDLAYFQDIIDDSYAQFLDVVSKERKIEMEELKKIANGRVFTGRQALDLKLVDTLGTFEDAVKIAAGICGIEGDPVLVKEKMRKNIFETVIEGISKSPVESISEDIKAEFLNKPVLQYKFER